MLSFKKGEAFPLPPRTEEGVSFSVEPYTMMLIYYFRRPSQEEIRAFAQGDAQLAVTVLRDTIFILSRFAPLSWMDTPYSAKLSDSLKSFPELKDGQGYSIDAFLVDCGSNILVEHRLMHMDTASSRKMKARILADQERTDFTREKYMAAVNEVYASYSTRELLKLAEFQTRLRK